MSATIVLHDGSTLAVTTTVDETVERVETAINRATFADFQVDPRANATADFMSLNPRYVMGVRKTTEYGA